MQVLFKSFSIGRRLVHSPSGDNKIIASFGAGILDKRPVKGPKEIFIHFAIGIDYDVDEVKEARFIRVK